MAAVLGASCVTAAQPQQQCEGHLVWSDAAGACAPCERGYYWLAGICAPCQGWSSYSDTEGALECKTCAGGFAAVQEDGKHDNSYPHTWCLQCAGAQVWRLHLSELTSDVWRERVRSRGIPPKGAVPTALRPNEARSTLPSAWMACEPGSSGQCGAGYAWRKHVSPAVSEGCVPCNGTAAYSDVADATECKRCPDGMLAASAEGVADNVSPHTHCMSCELGFATVEELPWGRPSRRCLACDGWSSYADEAGLSACKTCNPGEQAVTADGVHDNVSPHSACAVCTGDGWGWTRYERPHESAVGGGSGTLSRDFFYRCEAGGGSKASDAGIGSPTIELRPRQSVDALQHGANLALQHATTALLAPQTRTKEEYDSMANSPCQPATPDCISPCFLLLIAALTLGGVLDGVTAFALLGLTLATPFVTSVPVSGARAAHVDENKRLARLDSVGGLASGLGMPDVISKVLSAALLAQPPAAALSNGVPNVKPPK